MESRQTGKPVFKAGRSFGFWQGQSGWPNGRHSLFPFTVLLFFLANGSAEDSQIGGGPVLVIGLGNLFP